MKALDEIQKLIPEPEEVEGNKVSELENENKEQDYN